jgi:hypothetical protein
MDRFRFTLLAVCLVLLYLGQADLRLFFANTQPLEIPITELDPSQPPQEWMEITGGVLDLAEAISTSGTLEVDALLVPLVADPQQSSFHILVETHDQAMVDTFTTYYFNLDTYKEQQEFREQNQDKFLIERPVVGMMQGSLVASSNQERLRELAEAGGLNLEGEVLFLSEGKEPPRIRGFVFLALALLGLWKFATMTKKSKGASTPS